MLDGIRSFLRRFKPDSDLDERLQRNQDALKKKRLEAQLCRETPHIDAKTEPPAGNPLTAK